MLWIKNPMKWETLPLSEKLELLRKNLCTGPCGQSSSTLATRSAIDKSLKEAISILDSLIEEKK